MSVGRNDPCPCGSGKKYKRCCLPMEQASRSVAQSMPTSVGLEEMLRSATGHLQAGHAADTDRVASEILRVSPGHPEALHLKGLAARAWGDLDTAAEYVLQAVRADPGNPGYHANMGVLFGEMGRPAEALRAFQQASRLDPENPQLHYNAGNQYLALGEWAAARDTFERALELAPENAPAHGNLAYALHRLGDLDGAARAARRAAEREPGSAAPWLTLGAIAMSQGDPGQALRAYDEAQRRNPNMGEIFQERARALAMLGRHEESGEALRTFLDMAPDDPGRGSRALEALQLVPGFELAEHARRAREWANRHPVREAMRSPADDGDGPLRVGMMLPDPRHPRCAGWILPLLAAHDPAAVSVTVYSATEKPEGFPHGWRNIARQPARVVAEQVVEDDTRILVDLLGHAAAWASEGTLGVLRRRPAPVQLLWSGAGTTGTDAFDAVLFDAVGLQAGDEQTFLEPVARDEIPYALLAGAGADDELDETGGDLIMGAPAPAAALNDDLLAAWAAIMSRVPEVQLHLVHPEYSVESLRRAVYARLEGAGLTGARVHVMAPEGGEPYWQKMSLVLDTPPRSLGTALLGPLAAGLPCLVLASGPPWSRTGASLVRATASDETVAESMDAYAETAVALLQSGARGLADSRSERRKRVTGSPLADLPGAARRLEALYARLWSERLPV